jgi:hypothetical protein
MISAASERLHQYKIDVLFVIYPSSGISDEDQDECYQVIKHKRKNLFSLFFFCIYF